MNYKRILTYTQCVAEIERNKLRVQKWYLVEGMTASTIAEKLNIAFDNNFAKALSRVFAGAKGHGGARENSGNKKGVEFCSTCKKAKENCTCKKD